MCGVRVFTHCPYGSLYCVASRDFSQPAGLPLSPFVDRNTQVSGKTTVSLISLLNKSFPVLVLAWSAPCKRPPPCISSGLWPALRCQKIVNPCTLFRPQRQAVELVCYLSGTYPGSTGRSETCCHSLGSRQFGNTNPTFFGVD